MRIRERFQRMMYGRYGNDSLGTACCGTYLILWFVSFVFRRTVLPRILTPISYLLVILYFYRFFSKNIYRRQRENQKYLQICQKVKNYGKYIRLKFTERSGVNKLFRCPKCHQIIRVPKGRGKIAISCPKCRFEFVKRS